MEGTWNMELETWDLRLGTSNVWEKMGDLVYGGQTDQGLQGAIV